MTGARALETGLDIDISIRGLDAVPDVVLQQLKEGGRLIVPVARDGNLHSMRKFGRQIVNESSRPVRLSPAPADNVELPAVRAVTPDRR